MSRIPQRRLTGGSQETLNRLMGRTPNPDVARQRTRLGLRLELLRAPVDDAAAVVAQMLGETDPDMAAASAAARSSDPNAVTRNARGELCLNGRPCCWQHARAVLGDGPDLLRLQTRIGEESTCEGCGSDWVIRLAPMAVG